MQKQHESQQTTNGNTHALTSEVLCMFDIDGVIVLEHEGGGGILHPCTEDIQQLEGSATVLCHMSREDLQGRRKLMFNYILLWW